MTVTITKNHKEIWWRRYLFWIIFSAIAAPLSVILHELGHLLTYRAFGINDAVMHGSSVSVSKGDVFWQYVRAENFDTAASIYPLWQVAWASAAGPIVTIIIILVCCIIAARPPHPFVISLGLFAPLRFIVGFVYLYFLIFGNPSGANFDEINVARLTDLPVVILILIDAAVLFGGIFWLLRSIPQGERLTSVLMSILGGLVGFTIYFNLIAPVLFS